MQRRRSVHAAGLGLIGALALTGCASGPQPAGEAWKQARTQLDEADSLRLTTASTTGEQGPAVVAWDIAGDLDSGDGTTVGTMGVGEDSRLKVETRRVDGKSYARMSTEGPRVPEQLAAQYGDGQWREVPAEQAQDIRAAARFVTYGWGMIPVTVRVGETVWKTSLFPKDGLYLLPVKLAVRTTEQIEEGDEVTVQLEVG